MNLRQTIRKVLREEREDYWNTEGGMELLKKMYCVSKPIMVEPNEIHMTDWEMEVNQKHFDNYISGKKNKFFQDDERDPRKVDFDELSPVTLVKTEDGYNVIDGRHRVFLAKIMNKPIKARICSEVEKGEQKEGELTERCWSGYTQKGMKTMFGKRYTNCVKKKK